MMPRLWEPCPFDSRLARCPYLVLPKLAIQSMPMEWRERLEQLLVEAEAMGIETPEYEVVLAGGTIEQVPAEEGEWNEGEDVAVALPVDPWADYRYADIRALCPGYKGE